MQPRNLHMYTRAIEQLRWGRMSPRRGKFIRLHLRIYSRLFQIMLLVPALGLSGAICTLLRK